MRKLKLSLDALQVDSFAVGAAQPPVGTVRGNVGPTQDQNCFSVLCPITWNCSEDVCSKDIFCISRFPCVPTNENTCQTACANTLVQQPCAASCGTCAFTCQGATCAPIGQQCA